MFRKTFVEELVEFHASSQLVLMEQVTVTWLMCRRLCQYRPLLQSGPAYNKYNGTSRITNLGRRAFPRWCDEECHCVESKGVRSDELRFYDLQ